MSQGPVESVGNTREGQFGAIGTRREQWQVTATQPSSGIDASSFTAVTNSTTNTGDQGIMLCCVYVFPHEQLVNFIHDVILVQ